ncbi:MAG: hypothetical protein E7422_04265 [Ruminococcaceae bacterium]|nr:hypothetical protein [Oscillospiraceae bacterium]
MDLQILYDLKDCLEDAAGAGTDAVTDDFRLKSAVERFASLASGGGLFAQVYREACALLTAPPEDRPARLLDALDAVAEAVREYGATGVPGELAPLPPGGGGYVRAAYSELKETIAALDAAGSARIILLREQWTAHPEFFGDPRVMPHVVGALGDTHEEMEELLAAFLTKRGKRAVPYLKEGFDPAGADGKREMERRVYWVARLAGADENDWLLSVLPESRGAVRETVIAALGVSQDNAALLRGLYESETGKSRDAALRALACMDDPESRTLWAEELERRPDCPPFLEGVDSALAADMAAQALHSAYDEALGRGKNDLSQSELLTLAHAVYAAYGKYSDAMREEWLWCAGHMAEFDKLRPGWNVRHWDMSGAELLEKCLMETVLWNPCENVCALAQDLGAKYPNWFLGAAVLADLLAHPAEAFDRYGKYIVKNGLLRRENASERANRIQIMHALAAVRIDRENGRHIPFTRKDALNGTSAGMRYRLKEFDPRWAETLGDAKVNRDGAVFDVQGAWTMTKMMFQMEWIE